MIIIIIIIIKITLVLLLLLLLLLFEKPWYLVPLDPVRLTPWYPVLSARRQGYHWAPPNSLSPSLDCRAIDDL